MCVCATACLCVAECMASRVRFQMHFEWKIIFSFISLSSDGISTSARSQITHAYSLYRYVYVCAYARKHYICMQCVFVCVNAIAFVCVCLRTLTHKLRHAFAVKSQSFEFNITARHLCMHVCLCVTVSIVGQQSQSNSYSFVVEIKLRIYFSNVLADNNECRHHTCYYKYIYVVVVGGGDALYICAVVLTTYRSIRANTL